MKTRLQIINQAIGSMISIAGYRNRLTDPVNSKTIPIIIPVQTTEQSPVLLNDASSFAILAGSSIRNTGKTTITGELGLSPGTSVGGFPSGILIGKEHINDKLVNQAKLDLIAAYNDVAGRTCKDCVMLSGNIGGLTLTPGLYKSDSSLALSTGDLTFDAKENANAIFIIQIASTLIVRSGRKIILAGGALASDIFWQVGSTANFENFSVFKGTILAMQSITFNPGAKLYGRALSRNGSIVLAGNTIIKQ